MALLISIIFLLVLLIGTSIAIYNRLVALRNRFKNAFAQIDVQLKRRYDLIPNLVQTARGYMKHERETLEGVIQARSMAQQAESRASKNPENPELMRKLSEAEQGLSGALGRLFALSENYPDLKANENMIQLSEELTSTENKIAFARQSFNDSVMTYNTAREKFPNILFANLFGFTSARLFEIEAKEERIAPKVTF